MAHPSPGPRPIPQGGAGRWGAPEVAVAAAMVAYILSFSSVTEGSAFPINHTYVFMAFAAMALLYVVIRGRFFVILPGYLPLIVFALFALLSGVVAVNASVAIPRIKTIWSLLAFGLLVISVTIWVRSPMPAMLGLIVGGLKTSHEIFTSSSYVFGEARYKDEMLNPNAFGYDLVICLAFCIIIAYRMRRGIWSVMWLGMALWFTYVILFSSGSRTAIIGMSATWLIAVYVYYIKARFQSAYQRALVSGLSAVCVGVAIYMLFNSPFFSRLETLVSFASGQSVLEGSINHRYAMVIEGLDIWHEAPLLGKGFNYFKVYSSFNTYSHNNIIELLVSVGLIGTMMWYSVFALALLGIARAIRGSGSWRPLDNTYPYLYLCLLIPLLMMEVSTVSFVGKSTWLAVSVVLADMELMRREALSAGAAPATSLPRAVPARHVARRLAAR